jgi:hypothetical protein
MSDCRPLREKYNPKNDGRPISVLWIAESPPSGGGYFYYEEAGRANHLFRETMKALGWWPVNQRMSAGADKRPYLERFQKEGHFVIDLSYTPVDKMRERERKAVLIRNIPRILRELEDLDPQMILIINATLFPLLFSRINETKFGKRLLNTQPIPFPSHGGQRRFREETSRLLNRYDRRRSP